MAKLYGGWKGKIARVNLSKERSSDVPTRRYQNYIGGRGINAKIGWDELTGDTGAFDPENRLLFMTGPLTGTPAPSSGRTEVGGISPQTHPKETFSRSGFGGHWGPELKFAGYDGIIVQGKASKPVYLWINDGKIEILHASARL